MKKSQYDDVDITFTEKNILFAEDMSYPVEKN